MIPKQPTVNIQDFEESITVFVAPELKATAGIAPLLLCPAHCERVWHSVCNLTSSLRSAEALGVSSDRFTLVNFKTNQVFVAGTNAPEAIQQAVSSLATYLLGKKVLGATKVHSAMILGSPFGKSAGRASAAVRFGAHQGRQVGSFLRPRPSPTGQPFATLGSTT